MTSLVKCIATTGVAFGAVLAMGVTTSFAEESYPSKPVELVVGFGPGGPSGIAARFMQKRFEAVTGQELVIINKPGAGGANAWSQINQDALDGRHLTLLNFPHTVLQPIARGANAGYTDDDIHPVLFYTSVPQVIAVSSNSPFTSFEDSLAAIKVSPGSITIRSAVVGGSNHSAFYKFTQAAEVEATYIPFKNTSSTISALKSGTVHAARTFTTRGVRDGDTIRMLAIAAEERMPLFPDMPTMAELGYAKGGIAVEDVLQTWISASCRSQPCAMPRSATHLKVGSEGALAHWFHTGHPRTGRVMRSVIPRGFVSTQFRRW